MTKHKHFLLVQGLLIIAYTFFLISILLRRNEALMIVGLTIKLIGTFVSYLNWKSKMLLVGLGLQVVSFVTVLILGNRLEGAGYAMIQFMEIQAMVLEGAYVSLALSDVILMYQSSRITQKASLVPVYRGLSLLALGIVVIDILGYSFLIPTVLIVMISVLEFASYFVYAVILFYEMIQYRKNIKFYA